MKKLHVTSNRVLLFLLKSRLEEKGINCLIKNQEYAGQAAGDLPPSAVMPELWVMNDDDYDVAMELVRDELAHQSQTKQPWICPKCKEKLEGQFDICWKCDSAL